MHPKPLVVLQPAISLSPFLKNFSCIHVQFRTRATCAHAQVHVLNESYGRGRGRCPTKTADYRFITIPTNIYL